MAPIAVGDRLPEGTLVYADENDLSHNVSVHSLSAGKKVIIFGIPAAFTQVCSSQHVPSYIEKKTELKSKGVDDIICIAVNDHYVMKAWAKTFPENKDVVMLSSLRMDPQYYTRTLGLDWDLTEMGCGIRSRRFALLLDDLEVKIANIEDSADMTISGPDAILGTL